jgi:hypothetical protein
MDMIRMLEITPERLQELTDAEDLLLALQAAGVDNWDGYDHAMRILAGDEE